MPQRTSHIDQMYVQWTDGDLSGSFTDLEPRLVANITSVEVDDSLYLPDMFIIHLLDPDLKILQEDFFKLGRKIKISVGPRDTNTRYEIMRGEITSIEPELNAEIRSTLTVRGYDLSHKMNRTRVVTTYQNVTDSDLATRLASQSSLTSQVTATSIVYPYLMQANQTDWEFLSERAQRIGYRLFVEGKKLHFEPPPASPPEIPLVWGETLERFRPKLTTVEQITQVTVRGWDPKTKAAIVGQVSSPTSTMQNRTNNGQTGGSTVSAAHSQQPKGLVVDMPVVNQSEATKMAQALMDKTAGGFMEGEGRAGGNPQILAGSAVNISGVGDRFKGKYLVTHALHRYTADGYSTTFWVSGGSSSLSLTGLLSNNGGNGHVMNGKGGEKPTEKGIMVGIVTNNNDPDNLGRVQVKFPSLGDNIQSYWCRLASSMAGPTRGFAYFPEANDEVVVAFEHGDPSNAYVLGAVWNGVDKLPKPLSKLVTGGQTIRRVIRSRKGHEITIDDSGEPTEGIIVIDSTEKNFMQIKTLENKIIITCKGDLEISSQEGNISIKATMGKVDIQGQQNIGVKSDNGNVAIEASLGNVAIEASAGKSTIKGLAGVEATSDTGGAKIQGMTTDVTATAMVKIQGSLVKIN
ncbi:MAG: VgrG-related protein [Chloroflexi bacterium]|nr:VgrG-related protein [Chloroflexota bacterium]